MNTEKKKRSIKKAWYYVPLFQVPNSDHPLFRLIRKRIKWGKTHEDAKRHSWRFVVRLSLVWIILWILWTMTQVPASFSVSTRYYQSGLDGVGLLIGFSILLSYIFDLMTIVYSVNSINVEINLGRWDLLRLAMEEMNIVRAKYELARLRTWRFYLVMLSLRLSTVLILIIIFLQSLQLNESPLQRTDPPYVFAAFIFVAIGALYFFLEPFWRIKGISAMGLGIGARRKHTAVTTLYAFVVVFGSWIFKWFFLPFIAAIPLAAVLTPLGIILDLAFGTDIPQYLRELGGFGIGLLVFSSVTTTTWFYYNIAETTSFDAIRHRFK